MKMELHVHTQYSHDSLLDKYLMLLMCKLKKIECIAITDHNTTLGGRAFKGFLEAHGIKVIIGEEIFTADGEIIGLFLQKDIKAGLSASETVKLIREQGGLVYLPHPYDKKRYKTVLKDSARETIKNDIDLVEFHNGRNISSEFTKKQTVIANTLDAIRVVGSDAHIFFELGRNYNVIDSFSDKEYFFKCLLDNEYVLNKCCFGAHITTKFVRLWKMIVGGNLHEIYRVINKRIRNL